MWSIFHSYCGYTAKHSRRIVYRRMNEFKAIYPMHGDENCIPITGNVKCYEGLCNVMWTDRP
jgi:hypothetical protein